MGLRAMGPTAAMPWKWVKAWLSSGDKSRHRQRQRQAGCRCQGKLCSACPLRRAQALLAGAGFGAFADTESQGNKRLCLGRGVTGA